MHIYGLRNCDTCRKAEKALRDNGIEALLIDVRKDGIPAGELQRFQDTFGEQLLNRRSATWRQLSQAERQRDPLALLTAHPTLMKRPVIEHSGRLFLGWGKDVQNSLLG